MMFILTAGSIDWLKRVHVHVYVLFAAADQTSPVRKKPTVLAQAVVGARVLCIILVQFSFADVRVMFKILYLVSRVGSRYRCMISDRPVTSITARQGSH